MQQRMAELLLVAVVKIAAQVTMVVTAAAMTVDGDGNVGDVVVVWP